MHTAFQWQNWHFLGNTNFVFIYPYPKIELLVGKTEYAPKLKTSSNNKHKTLQK